jgi:hypothetical protein
MQIFEFWIHNTALKSENHVTRVYENQFELAVFLFVCWFKWIWNIKDGYCNEGKRG